VRGCAQQGSGVNEGLWAAAGPESEQQGSRQSQGLQAWEEEVARC